MYIPQYLRQRSNGLHGALKTNLAAKKPECSSLFICNGLSTHLAGYLHFSALKINIYHCAMNIKSSLIYTIHIGRYLNSIAH